MIIKATEMVDAQIAKGDEYVGRHRKRILMTLEELFALRNAHSPLCRDNLKILEVGGRSIIGDVIGTLWHTSIDETLFDLRYPWPIESFKYDLLVNCEVMEHIKDQDAGKVDFNDPYAVTALSTFNGSGLRCFLNEAYRVLKPGGLMFLTTPNSASSTTFRYLIHGCLPMIYTPHVREFTIKEAMIWLNDAKFREFQAPRTIQPWNEVTEEDWRKLRCVIAVPENQLGEVMVLVLQKQTG